MLQILSTFWGGYHIQMFKDVALKTLMWPKNRAALKGLEAKWNIYTHEADVKSLQEYCTNEFPEIKFNVISTTMLRDYIDPIQSATIKQIEHCVKTGNKLLLVPPDIIFSEGSIDALWKCGADDYSVVVSPHTRATPEVIDCLNKQPLSNAELVTLSFANLHECWIRAEKGHPNQCTYMGGVEWERLNNEIIIGKHLLPSPYLIQFTQEDLDYFKRANSFGNFDWHWPGDILVPRGRQRYAASSDICYFVEITDANKNTPPIYENQPLAKEQLFHLNQAHNHVNKQIYFTFRGVV